MTRFLHSCASQRFHCTACRRVLPHIWSSYAVIDTSIVPFHAPLSVASPINPPPPPNCCRARTHTHPSANPNPFPRFTQTRRSVEIAPHIESCGLIGWWRSTSSVESAERWTRLATAVASLLLLPPPSKDQRQHPTRHDEGGYIVGRGIWECRCKCRVRTIMCRVGWS